METENTLVEAIFQDISDKQASNRADKEAVYINRLLEHYSEPIKRKMTKLLNVGCGLGRHDAKLRQLGYKVYSLDINRNFIKVARERNPKFRQFYRVGNMANLPYNNASFDVVLCLFSGFNIPSATKNTKVLKEFARVLKNDGLLVMDLQNRIPTEANCGMYSVKTDNGITKVVKTRMSGNYLIGDERLYINENRKKREIAHEISKELLYAPDELRQLCLRAGFKILDFYKAYSMQKLSLRDPQYLVVAEKR